MRLTASGEPAAVRRGAKHRHHGHIAVGQWLPPFLRRIALALLCLTGWAGAGAADVEHYDLDVEVSARSLKVRAVLRVAPSQRLRLELADPMKVLDVTGAKWTREAGSLVVDPAGAIVTVTLAGAPRSQFSPQRGGFLRTVVSPEITYVRSQYPWYPRLAGDAATYRVSVRAPEGWRVRTRGVTSDGTTFAQPTPVRRIGLVAGPYRVTEREIQGVRFDAYTLGAGADRPGAQRLLDVAARAFDHYGKRFGALQVSHFTLVEMPAPYGPGSGYNEGDYVLLEAGAFERDAAWADGLVAHEVAHTWWGDQVAFRHFAGESLASYATLGFVQAEQGDTAAREERRKAVEAVVGHAGGVPLADIRDSGRGLGPGVYRVHAYDKGMMLLCMCEEALGRPVLDRALAGMLAAHRGELVDYGALREALGSKVRRLVEELERPGAPTLGLTYKAKRSGRKWRVKGTLTLDRPLKLAVQVRALCADGNVDTTVKLTGKKATFSLTTGTEPHGVAVDPDYRVLAGRPTAAGIDPGEEIELAFDVVRSPKRGGKEECEDAIARLRRALEARAGKSEGACHTGIGRCLFRLGRFDEAQAAFAEALRLGAGGPFHRRWVHLRLGCIADLEKKRDEAKRHYEKVLASSTRGHTSDQARRFLERPYRGYRKDG